jgi:ABC-2 type transport system permease protein
LSGLRLLLLRARAFVVRDFQLALSYRLQFLFQLLQVLFVVTTLFFISKIFAGGTVTRYSQWKDPLAAWIIGLAFLNYFMTGFSSFANAIRSEQMQGTLEGVLMTPVSVPTFIVSSSAYDFVSATFFSTLYLFFGWAFCGVEYRGNYFLALVFLVSTTLVLASLGILSASFTIVFKRGDPFAILLATGSTLFSGVFFPTQLINEYAGSALGQIPRLLPFTYGLDGLRRVLIEGQTFQEVRGPLFVLLTYLVVLLPFSIWVFTRALRRAKREGSLIQY